MAAFFDHICTEVNNVIWWRPSRILFSLCIKSIDKYKKTDRIKTMKTLLLSIILIKKGAYMSKWSKTSLSGLLFLFIVNFQSLGMEMEKENKQLSSTDTISFITQDNKVIAFPDYFTKKAKPLKDMKNYKKYLIAHEISDTDAQVRVPFSSQAIEILISLQSLQAINTVEFQNNFKDYCEEVKKMILA